jgi:hypothetical protein
VRLTLDLDVGHIRAFEVEHAGRTIAPLHTAPWVDEPGVAADPTIPPNLKYLSGDFFCAPFAKSDVEEAPSHGWPANSRWNLLGTASRAGGTTARYQLEKAVMGARLVKEITLRDGHAFAYQRHVFEGGNGAISVASHAMTRFVRSGRLSFSPKASAELPSMQQETDPARGRSVFAHPARTTDLTKLPLADGTTVDIHNYPVASGHEDFAMLVEAKGAKVGWTAAVRPDAGDIVFSLKNPADFPVTFLWFSNGGRYYPPWNRRHLGVLGIEEGRAYSAYGHAASIAPNPLSDAGVPTSLTLKPGGAVAVRHVIGGVPLPTSWSTVASVEVEDGGLRAVGNDGTAQDYPFDGNFLNGRHETA